MFQDKRVEEPLWLGYMDFTRARVGVRSWAKRQEEVLSEVLPSLEK